MYMYLHRFFIDLIDSHEFVKAWASNILAKSIAVYVFLFSDNQEVIDEYESLLCGPLSESEEWEVSRWVGRAVRRWSFRAFLSQKEGIFLQ